MVIDEDNEVFGTTLVVHLMGGFVSTRHDVGSVESIGNRYKDLEIEKFEVVVIIVRRVKKREVKRFKYSLELR
jgi:hypothetical protein